MRFVLLLIVLFLTACATQPHQTKQNIEISGKRITQPFNLTPLAPDDVAAYLEFRLRAAGYRGPNPFTGTAVEKIAHVSEGLSRRINILADKALSPPTPATATRSISPRSTLPSVMPTFRR